MHEKSPDLTSGWLFLRRIEKCTGRAYKWIRSDPQNTRSTGNAEKLKPKFVQRIRYLLFFRPGRRRTRVVRFHELADRHPDRGAHREGSRFINRDGPTQRDGRSHKPCRQGDGEELGEHDILFFTGSSRRATKDRL